MGEEWVKRTQGQDKSQHMLSELIGASAIAKQGFVHLDNYGQRENDFPILKAAADYVGTVAMERMGVDPQLFATTKEGLAAALSERRPAKSDADCLAAAEDFAKVVEAAIGVGAPVKTR